VRGTRAARLLQRGLVSDGIGAHLLRSVVVTRHALYQRPEGRDVACVPCARRVDAEVAGAAMVGSSRAAQGIGKAAHCIGFEIILQSSRIFCDSLTCHYPSRPQSLFLVHQTKLTSENRPEPARQPYSSLEPQISLRFRAPVNDRRSVAGQVPQSPDITREIYSLDKYGSTKLTGPGKAQNPIKSAGTYRVLTAKAECTEKKNRGSIEDQ
jgi:hypothetical protein